MVARFLDLARKNRFRVKRFWPVSTPKIAKERTTPSSKPEPVRKPSRLSPVLRPDGETRWLIARGRHLRDECGQISELIAVAIDITGQVKANLELRLQREEMARLSRVALMGELTASLAHELNQPLTALASNAAAGKRFLESGSSNPKMFAELLNDIFTDAMRAGDVIHGIRHLLRKGEGSRRSINVNEIVREVLRLLHSDLLGRSIRVETKLAPTLPVVQADPIHLQQVLLNLLMNATRGHARNTHADAPHPDFDFSA